MEQKSKRGGKRPGAGRKPKPPRAKTAREIAGEPLENAKHEKFAEGLAEGKTNRAAYKDAGYKPCDSAASRLASSEKVKERVDELKVRVSAAVIAGHVSAREYVIEALLDTLERCRQASPVLDRQGKAVMVETADGEMVPAYAFDAKNVLRSAELLGKEIGMFKEQMDLTFNEGMASALESARRRAKIATQSAVH